jgi:hypothetical protein
VICWLVTCAVMEKEINVDNLGKDYPMLAGNVAALGVSCIVTTVLSYAMPQNFDWQVMREGIHMIELDGTEKLADEGKDSEEGLRDALRCASLTLPHSSCLPSANDRGCDVYDCVAVLQGCLMKCELSGQLLYMPYR